MATVSFWEDITNNFVMKISVQPIAVLLFKSVNTLGVISQNYFTPAPRNCCFQVIQNIRSYQNDHVDNVFCFREENKLDFSCLPILCQSLALKASSPFYRLLVIFLIKNNWNTNKNTCSHTRSVIF